MHHRLRTAVVALATISFLGALSVAVSPAAAGNQSTEYVVLVADGATTDGAAAAVAAAGGTVTAVNSDVGMVTATSSNATFATDVAADAAVDGAARNSVIGYLPAEQQRTQRDIEEARDATNAAAAPDAGVGGPADPLTNLQWDMDMISAPEAHAENIGTHKVKVGVMDTGIDGTHPDIAPNFNAALSRNFVTDIPLVDGPCEVPSCVDPANEDGAYHGTHVAGTIASPRNGIGIEGVAPGVELVNVRAGQDSGYFFIGPFVNALTYSADVGLDVVNMSFFTDPRLFNCEANPADTPEQQLEQQTVRKLSVKALNYAAAHDVTVVAALGNEHTDLSYPTTDSTSPDFPPGTAYTRTVDNSCLVMPTEGPNVIGVTSIGPSGRKADYSNYGIEQADISAPGGYFRDFPDDPTRYRTVNNLILSTYPEAYGRAVGTIDAAGNPTTPFVVADCSSGTCSYYQYLQGTSMASPHAAGVAALVVAAHGNKQGQGGFGLDSKQTTKILYRTATQTPCPPGGVEDYVDRGPESTAVCEGNLELNGFYGHGIVNALDAVLGKH